MPEPDILSQAIEAARRGERRRARQMLTRILRSDQKNEQAWLWMSAVVDSDRERVFCLQSVLRLNPANRAAESGLMLLGAIPAKERPRSILDEYQGQPPGSGDRAVPRDPRLGFFRRRRNYEWVAVTAVASALICCVALAWSVSFTRRQLAAFQAAQTTEAFISPTPSLVPSVTLIPPPSATPSVRTATPTFDAATPLAFRVGATFVPTVVYFETPHAENDAYQAGLRRYYSGDWPELIRFMQTALDANPGLFEAHFYIGEAHRQTGKPADAVEEYDAAIELNESFAPAFWGRGLAQASLGRATQALADLERASQSDPSWPAPYIERANLLRAQGDLEGARDALISARTVAPGDAGVRWNLARVLADLGDADAAMSEIDAALAADPTVVETYLVRGRLLLVQEHYHEARADLGLYLTYRPNDAAGWYYRALAGVALADEATALADFDRALALAPNYSEALISRGDYYLKLARYDEALADYDAALAQADSAPARLGRGLVSYAQGNLTQAVLDLRRAVNRAPEDYAANYWLGRALVESEQAGDAISPLTSALEVAASDQERQAVYQARAAAYRQLGRLEDEAADLSALLALKDGDDAPQQTAEAELSTVQAAITNTVIAASATRTPSVTPEPSATPVPSVTRTPTRTVAPSQAPTKTVSPSRTPTSDG